MYTQFFDSEVFEVKIWTLKTPTRPFLNSSLFWQPTEFRNIKESSKILKY